MLEDSSTDPLGWVANNIARAVGTKANNWWVAGTGSTMPTGVMNSGAVGASGTVATGGSLLLGSGPRHRRKADRCRIFGELVLPAGW
jgi:HK97 family phage major capsid protein